MERAGFPVRLYSRSCEGRWRAKQIGGFISVKDETCRFVYCREDSAGWVRLLSFLCLAFGFWQANGGFLETLHTQSTRLLGKALTKALEMCNL